MTFGWSYSSSKIENQVAGKMLDAFFDAGHKDVDTALTYAGGKTEEMIGALLGPDTERAKRLGVLATKAGPWQGMTMNGNGGLSPEELRKKVETSCKSLKRDSIDLFYLHAPDTATRIEDTLATVNQLHKEGKIKALGLSNFQAWEVCYIHQICSKNNYLSPTVYQGMYNAVTREVERELLPCLRKLGISFYCYNPLAGGILSGKHQRNEDPSAGRFQNNKMYKDRFWKDSFFDAAESIQKACDAEQTSMVSAAFRWLLHHSKLQDGDAIIIGASSEQQLDSNLKALKDKNALSPEVLSAIDTAWERCKADCPSYERGSSAL